jgi:hypothetical protein
MPGALLDSSLKVQAMLDKLIEILGPAQLAIWAAILTIALGFGLLAMII